MGESKRRERKRFERGPVLTKRGWVWMETDGHIYRLTRGRRIEDTEFRAAVQAEARPADGRIVRPSGDDVLRMAAEAGR